MAAANGNGTVALVFDIDGTLLTTGGAGAKAWGDAFRELDGVSANIEDLTEAGMPDQEVGRVTFVNVIGREPEPGELAKVMTRYLHHLPAEVETSAGYRTLSGAPALCAASAAPGTCSGSQRECRGGRPHQAPARGLNSFFCFGGYGSDSPHRGELTQRAIERAEAILGAPVAPSAVLVVGDTPRDVEAARYAAAVAVAVASGHFTADELAGAGADHVLRSLDDEVPL